MHAGITCFGTINNLKALLSSKKQKFGDKSYRWLNTIDGNTPRMYGLPKIHKENIPLRPIVSFVGSTTYELSKYLSRILSPIVGKTEHYIRNTYDWVHKSRELRLSLDEELVSFDVTSLFTSIPTGLAVQVVKLRLDNDDTLMDRTTLTPNDIVELLEFCLNSTEFQFREHFYKQIHGTAMGSPVSVVIANMVMADLELKALDTFPQRPKSYYRYFDDTIVVLKRTRVDAFHDHLNQQNYHIKFTIERDKGSGIPFLDTFNIEKILLS